MNLFRPSELLKTIQALRHKHTRNILNGIEGVVTPGEMLRAYSPSYLFMSLRAKHTTIIFHIPAAITPTTASSIFTPTITSNPTAATTSSLEPNDTNAVVLGRPGAGCTTFLQTMSSHLPQNSGLRTNGTLQYDSLPSPLPATYIADLQYCPEADVHLPTLTVEETLAFAARTVRWR